MKILLLSMFALSICAAEMPSDVQAAIDKADKACSTVQAKADSDITKLRQGLVASLTKLQEGYTKKGNLDAANGIKAKIDETSKQISEYSEKLLAAQPASKDPAPLAGMWQVMRVGGGRKCSLQVEKNQTTVTELPAGVIGSLRNGTISWNNGTSWLLSWDGSAWMISASDGALTLQR